MSGLRVTENLLFYDRPVVFLARDDESLYLCMLDADGEYVATRVEEADKYAVAEEFSRGEVYSLDADLVPTVTTKRVSLPDDDFVVWR